MSFFESAKSSFNLPLIFVVPNALFEAHIGNIGYKDSLPGQLLKLLNRFFIPCNFKKQLFFTNSFKRLVRTGTALSNIFLLRGNHLCHINRQISFDTVGLYDFLCFLSKCFKRVFGGRFQIGQLAVSLI